MNKKRAFYAERREGRRKSKAGLQGGSRQFTCLACAAWSGKRKRGVPAERVKMDFLEVRRRDPEADSEPSLFSQGGQPTYRRRGYNSVERKSWGGTGLQLAFRMTGVLAFECSGSALEGLLNLQL